MMVIDNFILFLTPFALNIFLIFFFCNVRIPILQEMYAKLSKPVSILTPIKNYTEKHFVTCDS